jgi:hypothetical protein
MSRWTGPLVIEQDISAGRQRVRLLQPLIWERGHEGSGDLLVVEPDGTWTDGLSIPVQLEWLADRVGRGLRAAVTHDDLIKKLAADRPDPRFVDRLSIDRLFREQLQASGFGPKRRNILYAGVRAADRFPALADFGRYTP